MVLPVLAGFAGCLTEINNEYYENKLTDRAKDIQCYLGFIEGPVFGKLNRDDIVYVYGYNGVNNIIRNDQEYLRAVFHDEAPHLVTDIQELDLSGKEYCLYRNDKDNAVYFGKIDPDMRTSRVLVVSQDELTEKSLWIGRTLPQSGDIFVNNEWKGIYSGDAVVPLCI